MSDKSFMAKPCPQCPFRHDVKPFLHTERAEDIAYAAENKYNTFPCHKTTVSDEESDYGDRIEVGTSKECAGFLTLRANIIGEEFVHEIKDGFKPAYDLIYDDACHMTDAYAEQNGD